MLLFVVTLWQHAPVTSQVASGGVTPGQPRLGWSDPRAPLLVLPAVLVLAVVAELSLAHAGVGADGILTDTASGLAFAFAGLIAWRRRPSNRSGRLMTGVGIGWFGGDLLFTPIPLVGPLSFLAQAAARILFAWLMMAYPSGRLGSPLLRLSLGVIGAMAGGLGVLQLLTLDPADLCACPSSPFAVARDTPLAGWRDAVGATVGLAMAAILVAMAVARTIVASRPARRFFLPVLAGGAFSLLSVVPQLIDQVTGAEVEPFGWLPLVWVALPLGFLWGLLNARLARAAVADLVVDLDAGGLGRSARAQRRSRRSPSDAHDAPIPERLQHALASALDDPTLEVARWSARRAAYVNSSGSEVELPSPDSGRAVTLLERGGRPLAAILHDPALADDPGLVASVASAVRLAVENERLAQEVRSQLAAVRASRARIVDAGDAERRRLERDLHDGAQQRLVALSLALRRAQSHVDADADAALSTSLDDAAGLIRDALDELRELARGLHPAVLTEAGLAGAIAALCSRSPVSVKLLEVPPDRLSPKVESAAYFFVSEALTNVAKHAPGAEATVSITHVADELQIVVTDNGPGGASPDPGSGLQGLEDRLAALGGGMGVVSPPGGGTTLRAWVPTPTE